MKILFLFPYPLEQAPSQRFRFEQYFSALVSAGYSINSQSFWGDYYWKVLYKKGNGFEKLAGLLNGFLRRCKILGQVPSADFVFIHRELTPVGPPVFEWLIAKVLRKKIIFDFDDAIWLPNTSEQNRLAASLKWHGKTGNICRWAHKISAGNNYLAAYARLHNTQVVVNPTTIDTQHHFRQASAKKTGLLPVIGWTGTHSTLPYLHPLWTVLEAVFAKVPFEFVVIANERPAAQYPWLRFLPWKKETEIEDLCAFDIGVMPLADDEWSKGKCGFKALQYMALSIPTVASPVGVNSEIIHTGVNGLLCEGEKNWLLALTTLLTDETERRRIGEAGKKTVDEGYSVASNTGNFLALFGK